MCDKSSISETLDGVVCDFVFNKWEGGLDAVILFHV